MLKIKNPQSFYLIRKKMFKKLARNDYTVGFYDGYFYKTECDQQFALTLMKTVVRFLGEKFSGSDKEKDNGN